MVDEPRICFPVRIEYHFRQLATAAGCYIVNRRGGVEDTRLEAKDTKKSEAKAKDSLSEDRHSRGHGQECSRPRPRTKDTSASTLQKKKVFTKIFQTISKKKKVFTKIFQAIFTKNVFQKIFQALDRILTIQKIVLSSSRGQAIFQDLRPRGQGQGL